VLIVQINEFNDSPIRTVVTVALTSNLHLAHAPGNVLCSRRDTGLSKQSVINVSQVATVDKRQLLERAGVLGERRLLAVETGLRLVMGL
jgi:mRNA interferase MazF